MFKPRSRNVRSKYRCSNCTAIRINSRNWPRSSSTREPSDPPLGVVFYIYNFNFKNFLKKIKILFHSQRLPLHYRAAHIESFTEDFPATSCPERQARRGKKLVGAAPLSARLHSHKTGSYKHSSRPKRKGSSLIFARSLQRAFHGLPCFRHLEYLS